ncbi:MAG: hypothetical protein J7513_08505 [Solirubrobacteraceae bacterium]|nr:hypothetical protein [Solirubrobacteraceae bacterium]
MLRFAALVLATLVLLPATASAYGPKVVGLSVDGNTLYADGDATDNHLGLERVNAETVRLTVWAGEAIGLGEPGSSSYAGDRCTRVDAERTVDCAVGGLAQPTDDAPYQRPMVIDLAEGDSDVLIVTGNLGMPLRATSSAAESTMIGGGEVDEFTGGPGSDTLEGRGGDDVLDGGWGEDVLRGGEGDDDLTDSEQVDAFDAGPGDDLVSVRRNPYVGEDDQPDVAADGSTCGDGDDLVWGLNPGETSWIADCERRSGPVDTSEILPMGLAGVGWKLSLTSTTISPSDSPVEVLDISWRRCPEMDTDASDCTEVGTGPTYTVTADDHGAVIVAFGFSGWFGPGPGSIGFGFERRIPVGPKPPSVVTPTVTPTPTPKPAATPIPKSLVPPNELAARVRSLVTGTSKQRGVAKGGKVTFSVPQTIGAPVNTLARVKLLSKATKRSKAKLLGSVLVNTSKPGAIVLKLNKAGRKLVAKKPKTAVTVQITLKTPAGETGTATGKLVLNR